MTKIGTLISKALKNNDKVILDYGNDKYRKENWDIVNSIKHNLKGSEAYHLYTIAKELAAKRKGLFAEVGVASGNSAEIICKAKGCNPLYLFDTWEGLPKPSKEDGDEWVEGEMKYDILDLTARLAYYPRVYFYKGIFPKDTCNFVDDYKFIFVHIDVDLYQSIKDCLEFFYPRMEKGGIIITHDYIGLPSGKKAFDEFFKDKPEQVIELTGCQAVVVKA